MFEKSKWIWINENDSPDEYAEFLIDFNLERPSEVDLNISVDGNFEAYLNGKLCAFGACSDYPDEKYYDVFNLDGNCVIGANQLKITVWHIGVGSSVYVAARPGLLFSVTQSGEIISYSSECILSRRNTNYVNGLCKSITMQLGPSFKYDCAVNNGEYFPSIVVNKTDKIVKREIENLRLLGRADIRIENKGKSILVDFGKETVGYIDADFVSEADQELLVVFGERLDEDGHVPRFIGSRDFSFELIAKQGRNKFFNAMRRIAGRYLEIWCDQPLKIEYFGVRQVVYPLNVVETHFEAPLHQRIYDTCVYTLRCCMHEHYEDCPWREQALYALDSRNQMLSGYIAFKEYRYARFNLVLLARSLKGGLLRITSPTDTDLPIPFFSLAFVQQVYEYLEYSGDRSILDEVGFALDTIMQSFVERIKENGLAGAFPAPAWNFYEWSAGNSGEGMLQPDDLRYDLCLNAMFIFVASMYENMRGKLNISLDGMRRALKEMLYDGEKGFFVNSSWDSNCSVLGNALAILAGVGDKALADRIISQRDKLTDNTLSMNGYVYDALLSLDESYKDYILKDIEEKYSYMLDSGATTFWETIEGWRAFSEAGSLCHGWSAIPIYYLKKLI